jgi:hypothetical protein
MFDVKKHLIKVQGGRQYLPVAARLIWFRTEHPDWGIDTRALTIDVEKQFAVFEAAVYNAEGRLMAKGTKLETVRGFGDWLEKAETGAIGRALAVCGFGTQFAPDLDEAHGDNFGDLPLHHSAANGARYSGQNARAAELSVVTNTPIHSESCIKCNAVLKPNQLSLSLRKYGSALCPDCQKKQRADQVA